MKHLGKKPPKKDQEDFYGRGEHFRQSLLEAADELDNLTAKFADRRKPFDELVRGLRRSAGE